MKRPRPKASFIPVLGLLAAVLVLLTVVTVTTYFNLKSGKNQARRVLDAQAQAVVSGLAAGLRTGWRHWIWQADSLQGLVQEMSHTGDVAFIALLDADGLVLAHSETSLVGGRLSEDVQKAMDLDTEEIRGRLLGNRLYLAGRKLREDEISLPHVSRERMMMQPGLMMRRGRITEEEWQRRVEKLDNLPRPAVVLVGLKTKTLREAQARQLQHALIMGGLLFVLGSAAIYFIFVIQNYRTVERTLTDLSTYTSNIVDNMPNGLITLDHLGEPVMINRAARELFGWSDRAEATLAREPVIGALSREFGPLAAEGRPVLEVEFEAPAASGERLPLAVSAASAPTESGSTLILILRDLRKIRELETRVQRSEKLAAVGQLAAGVAHEVRNPLSSMRGLARFLARGLDESSREAQYLKVMVEEIDRLNRVVTGLLDYARPRTPEPGPVRINEAAAHTVGLIEDDARRQGIEVRMDLDLQDPVIRADRDMAVQAMLNLLLNGVEAMPGGGRLMVSTRSDNNQGAFIVEDTGPGIPAADRSRLADPFFTTKKKGAGLGLAQVAGIMEAHGGRLEVAGEPGRGARVSLRFPLFDEPQPEVP